MKAEEEMQKRDIEQKFIHKELEKEIVYSEHQTYKNRNMADKVFSKADFFGNKS